MSMRKIYRQIAKKKRVSISEVKRDMQAAINAAYNNPNSYANSVSRKSEIPTIEEFVNYTSNRVKKVEKLKKKNDRNSEIVKET